MSMHENDTPDTVTVQIVNAFTVNGTGGNPAGVVLDAGGLGTAAMLSVAAQTGLSETAFVSESKTEGSRLDFFTPTRRIAHCGHATVAAFALLRAEGRIGDGPTSKETVDGPRKILVRDGSVFMEQRAPRYQPAADWAAVGVTRDTVLASTGLSPDRLDARVAPVVVDTGNRFLLIGVADPAVLAAVVADQGAIAKISEALDLIGFYLFSVETGDAGTDATARMFAPRYGISEESATGMAAGPLACLLHDLFGPGQDRFVIEQGRFMAPPSPSRIIVDLDIANGQITGLMAGGEGKSIRSLRISPGASSGRKAGPAVTAP